MDDTSCRHAVGGGLPERLPVTLLAGADEDAHQALADWMRGLDWLQPLFAGHRQQLTALHFVFVAPSGTEVYPRAGVRRAALEAQWRDFTQGDLPGRLAPDFGRIWQAAAAGVRELAAADAALGFAGAEAERSLQAGRLLLERLQGARHLGRLGRYRAAWLEGRVPGHFFAAWAAVAGCFQIGLAAAVAEYLRLEWRLAAVPLMLVETEPPELAASVARFLRASGVPVLTGVTAPPSSSAGENRGVLP